MPEAPNQMISIIIKNQKRLIVM